MLKKLLDVDPAHPTSFRAMLCITWRRDICR